ncbi:hypothetical protein GCM10009107_19910 [Ideonella azotifigens]|uniref:Uncharacterized protein n=1 Tax=Ideonella azotifigens TaxID=513160 RepID=A0ABP3V6A5_9BURK
MDDGIHCAARIDLAGKIKNLRKIGQITDRGDGVLVHEFLYGRHAPASARARRLRGPGPAQSIGRAGNEHAGLDA